MTFWSLPHTEEAMAAVERVMSRPLGARAAGDLLDRLTGEARLFEKLRVAAGRDADADVRPLVAMLLEEWSLWSPPDEMPASWRGPLRERARRLAETFRDEAVDGLLPTAMPDAAEAAVKFVAGLLDVREGLGRRFMAARGGAPGVWAVLDCELDGLFRVDVVDGSVEAADASVERGLKTAFFGVPSGTRH